MIAELAQEQHLALSASPLHGVLGSTALAAKPQEGCKGCDRLCCPRHVPRACTAQWAAVAMWIQKLVGWMWLDLALLPAQTDPLPPSQASFTHSKVS